MGKNKTNFETFFEKRLLWEVGGLGLKDILESSKENVHAEDNNKDAFETSQKEDVRETKPVNDTHEKSKESLAELMNQKEKVKKLTREQLTRLKAKIERISGFDQDAALETSEIQEIGKAIDRLGEEEVVKNEEPAKEDSPIQLSELKREKGKEWMDKKVKTNQNAKDFLDNLIDKNIEEVGENFKKGIEAANQTLSELGLAVSEGMMREMLAKKITQLGKVENIEFNDLLEASKKWTKDEPNPIQNYRMNSMNGGENVKKALSEIQKNIETKTKKITKDLAEVDFGNNPSVDKKALLEKLGELQGVKIFEGKEITAEFISDYLLKGGDLIEDIKNIAISQEWEKIEPQLDTLAGEIPKEQKKELLGKLSKMSLGEVLEFQKNAKELFEIAGKLDKLIPQKEGNQQKLLEKFELMKDGKIDLLAINAAKINEIKTKSEALITKIDSLNVLAQKTVETINVKLAEFGGKIETNQFEQKITGKIFKKIDIGAIIDNPALLDQAALEGIKEIFKIKDLVKAEDAPTKIAEYIESYFSLLDNILIKKLSDQNFEIDGIKPKLKKEDLEKILPNIKKQLIPTLSEFFEQSPDYGISGLKLLENGNLNFDNLEKILNSEKFAAIKTSMETVMQEESKEKQAQKLGELLKLKDKGTLDTVDLTEKIGKFLITKENPTPAVKAIQDEVLSVVPIDVKLKLGAEKLQDAFTRGIELIKEKGFFGAIGEVLALILPSLTKLISSASGWWKETKNEYGKPIVDAISSVDKDSGKQAGEFMGITEQTPEQKETAAEKLIQDALTDKNVNDTGLKEISMKELFDANDDTKRETLAKKENLSWSKEDLKTLQTKLGLKIEANDAIRTDNNKKVFDAISEKPELLT